MDCCSGRPSFRASTPLAQLRSQSREWCIPVARVVAGPSTPLTKRPEPLGGRKELRTATAAPRRLLRTEFSFHTRAQTRTSSTGTPGHEYGPTPALVKVAAEAPRPTLPIGCTF